MALADCVAEGRLAFIFESQAVCVWATTIAPIHFKGDNLGHLARAPPAPVTIQVRVAM